MIKYLLTSIFIFAFIGVSPVHAGDIVFETEMPWYKWWSSGLWGNGTFGHPNTFTASYRPTTDQEVCIVNIGLYKSGNPTDNIKLDIIESTPEENPNGYPSLGSVISTTAISGESVSDPSIVPSIAAYTPFHLPECLNLTSDTYYSFIFTRTQPDPENYYFYQLSSLITYSETRFWFKIGSVWNEKINYEPALKLEGPEEELKTPVLIIPGIAGSELKKGDDLIWANLFKMAVDLDGSFLANLNLDENGGPVNSEVEVGEAIKRIFNVPFLDVNIFKDLEDHLVLDTYILNQTLFYFPYDWRIDLSDTTILLSDKIDQIKEKTGSEKINIIAHSMGGLLSKEYIYQYGEENIDKLIFIGTPHIGAPKAGKVILAGDKFSIPWLNKDRIKEIANNSTALHELLPNQFYFDIAGRYFTQNDFLNYNQTKELLIENGSSENVFNSAEELFSHELEKLDLSNIDTYNIAGCTQGTQSRYDVREDGTISRTYYKDGDQTVPLVSAATISIPDDNTFFSTEGTHAELPSRPGVRSLISDILADNSLGSYSNISESISECGIEGQELVWHSPVEIHIYDSQNRHTGPLGDGGLEYGIPGVDYEIVGHEKFIYLPSNTEETYQVTAIGLEEGTFDLSIRKNEDGNITEEKSFDNIPIAENDKVNFEISEDQPTVIKIDENGDGENDTGYNSDGTSEIYEATIEKIKRDALLFYDLGWITKKSSALIILKKAEGAGKIEKKLIILEEKFSERKDMYQWISRFIQRFYDVLATRLSDEVEKQYNKGNINEKAHDLLIKDIEGLWGE